MARESYLVGDKIIGAAKRTHSEAIHPGYGFLSENAGFAQAVQDAGLVWVGPPASAIEAMGSKSASKRIMEDAGVPVVPGYHGDAQDDATLRKEADRVGYPLLIKAVLGGGGKGMRIVERAEEFGEGLAAARREALNSFGDDRVLVERYIKRPRHIELQVFADSHGNCVYLFERDCSVQRRHQKVLEEAPAPGMAPELRAKMGEAAVAAAKAVGYVGAGTVEFIFDCDTDEFFFMEMNTRLQVEHPVTEMITGQDLVEWQLAVAAGRELPLPRQDMLAINGHSLEARIYAENPAHNFLPGAGTLEYLRPPATGPDVRVETGVVEGDAVSIYYDPMIAKLVVHAQDRPAALRRMEACLRDYHIAGLSTNIDFLKACVRHPDFVAGTVDTGFISRNHADLFPRPGTAVPTRVLAVAAAQIAALEQAPFGRSLRHWRGVAPHVSEMILRIKSPYEDEDDAEVAIRLERAPATEHISVSVDGTLHAVIGREVDGLSEPLSVVPVGSSGRRFAVFGADRVVDLEIPEPSFAALDHAGAGDVSAPMPGQVTSVLVQPGQTVAKGDPLLVMIAMKMEHTIRSPFDAIVDRISVKPDDQVSDKSLLLSLRQKE